MFTEDLDEFFDIAEHAETVVQDTKSFLGIFSDEFDGQFDVTGRTPVLVVKDTDLAAAPVSKQGVDWVIKGATYRVQEIQRDGTGTSLVRLEAV